MFNGDNAYYAHKQRQVAKKRNAQKRAKGDLSEWDSYLEEDKVYINA